MNFILLHINFHIKKYDQVQIVTRQSWFSLTNNSMEDLLQSLSSRPQQSFVKDIFDRLHFHQ